MELSAHVDHLVLAGGDLKAGIEMFHERLGVRPIMGGRHANWGTWNAVVALGPRTYLELIAPDPDLEFPADRRPALFNGQGDFRLTGWLAAVERPDRVRRDLLERGVDTGRILQGARSLPDGGVLEWSLSDPMVRLLDGVIPLLIDWGQSPHPAESAPSGCRLTGLSLRHPDFERANVMLELMGLPPVVIDGASPALQATLATPRGDVVLQG